MKIGEVITYRVSATGVWSYEFYSAGEMIGTVSAIVGPNVPVYIRSQNHHWYSTFPIDTTVVPGVGRRVKDNVTGDELYRLIYWKPGLYQVRGKDGSIDVEMQGGNYLFGLPGAPVTAISERVEGKSMVSTTGMTMEPVFRTVLYEDVDEAYSLMVLSFPTLRFY